MKLSIIAVGKARPGPEASLVADYLSRLDPLGRGVALGPAKLIEIDPKRASAEAVLAKIASGARVVALDEKGRDQSSVTLSETLARWRDEGVPEVAFLIGGADGHEAGVRDRADLLLSFGKATWPHMLCRAMLTEQLYRAVSIAARHPYHREG